MHCFEKTVCLKVNSNFLILSLIFFCYFSILEGHKSLKWGLWCPCFGLLVIIAMCFEAGIDPLLVCFQTWLQWIPQIHLRCNTYSTLDSKNYSREADQDYSAPSCTLSAQDFFFNFIQFSGNLGNNNRMVPPTKGLAPPSEKFWFRQCLAIFSWTSTRKQTHFNTHDHTQALA